MMPSFIRSPSALIVPLLVNVTPLATFRMELTGPMLIIPVVSVKSASTMGILELDGG